MTRRGLIGALMGAATLDPERLLWVPGAKVISIPKPLIWNPAYQYSEFEENGKVSMVLSGKSKFGYTHLYGYFQGTKLEKQFFRESLYRDMDRMAGVRL